MVMNGEQISASRFKAQCLALIDEVAATGRPLIVTKRGRAVVRVEPLRPPETLEGSVQYLVEEDELLRPIPQQWHAER